MKLNCIIDTCSSITLSNVSFFQKAVLKFFNDKANLNYCKEVSIELRDHKDKDLPVFILNSQRVQSLRKCSIEEYERKMLGRVLVSRAPKGNKGEIDNFLLSVDQVHEIKKNSVIYITDDKKALGGILKDWLLSFPTISVWTSFEVILYLYAERVIPSKDVANDLIQDLINFTSPRSSERSVSTTQELMTLKKQYSSRLEMISKLIYN